MKLRMAQGLQNEKKWGTGKRGKVMGRNCICITADLFHIDIAG